MQLHRKFSKKGLVIVGLSNEATDKVTKHLKKYETPFIIGAGSKCLKAWGIKGYPTFFVVDTKGVVTYKGHSVSAASKAVKSAMQKTPPSPGLPFGDEAAAKDLAAAEKYLKAKKYTRALKEFASVIKEYPDTPAAKKAKKKLARLKKDKKIMAKVRRAEAKKKCTAWLDMARSLAKAGNPAAARKYYQRILDGFGDSPYADTARIEMARL